MLDCWEPEYNSISFDGSFNVSRIECGGVLVGLELEFIANRPYGYGNVVTVGKDLVAGESFEIYVDSDEYGVLFPTAFDIVVWEAGDITITNSRDPIQTVVNGFVGPEYVRLECDKQIATTNVSDHKLCKDFNFHFPRLYNSFADNKNVFTV